MTIRIRTFAPLVPVPPTAAQARPRPQTAAPPSVGPPAGRCRQDLALADDPRVLPQLDQAALTVPGDVGAGCPPLGFTPESQPHRVRPQAVTAA